MFEDVLAIHRRNENVEGIGTALLNLGVVHYALGEHEASLRALRGGARVLRGGRLPRARRACGPGIRCVRGERRPVRGRRAPPRAGTRRAGRDRRAGGRLRERHGRLDEGAGARGAGRGCIRGGVRRGPREARLGNVVEEVGALTHGRRAVDEEDELPVSGIAQLEDRARAGRRGRCRAPARAARAARRDRP